MGKWIGWGAAVFAAAFLNCAADHIVKCLFKAAGGKCPFEK
jgi:hypothetical protein